MMENIIDHPQPPDAEPPASLLTHWMRLADALCPSPSQREATAIGSPSHEHQ